MSGKFYLWASNICGNKWTELLQECQQRNYDVQELNDPVNCLCFYDCGDLKSAVFWLLEKNTDFIIFIKSCDL